MTPFEAVYGQPPPQHLPYLPRETKVDVVARSLEERDKMILLLKFHLMRAQHRMKQVADEHQTERSFNIVVGNVLVSTELPNMGQDMISKEPESILEREMVRRQHRPATIVLVKWVNEPSDEATWEFLFDLEKRFPNFKP
ncbi:hypothetical protein Bca101_072572 [Brassica carinata]